MVCYIEKTKLRIKKGYTMKICIKWAVGVRDREWGKKNERQDEDTWKRKLEKRELSNKTNSKHYLNHEEFLISWYL